MLLIIGTVCLCLTILVGGSVAAVLLGKLTPELLGTFSGLGAGGGLLGFGVILYQIIKHTF